MRVFISIKKWRWPSTIHSKVDTESNFTAVPNRTASSSIFFRISRSRDSVSASSSRRCSCAFAAAHGDEPLAVTHHLDFLVAGGFDVQFDQHVFVVADTVAFHLGQNFAQQ